MTDKNNKTRTTLKEAKSKKGKSNIGKLLVEQQKEKKKKH
jgi:hypothetical protein